MSQYILQIEDEAKAAELINYLKEQEGVDVKNYNGKHMSSEAMKVLLDLRDDHVSYGEFTTSRHSN